MFGEKLEFCGLCGGLPLIYKDNFSVNYVARCYRCTQIIVCDDLYDAVEIWNATQVEKNNNRNSVR